MREKRKKLCAQSCKVNDWVNWYCTPDIWYPFFYFCYINSPLSVMVLKPSSRFNLFYFSFLWEGRCDLYCWSMAGVVFSSFFWTREIIYIRNLRILPILKWHDHITEFRVIPPVLTVRSLTQNFSRQFHYVCDDRLVDGRYRAHCVCGEECLYFTLVRKKLVKYR